MTESINPPKNYQVVLPDTGESEIWDEAKYNRNRDALFNDHKNAMVLEVAPLTNGGEIDGNGSYLVNIPGEAEIWDGEKLARNREQLMKDHPEVKIQNARYVNYWGDKLQEGEDRIKALEEELKGIPEDVPLSEDPRAIQGGSIVGMQKLMVEKQRREAPNRERRGQIKREIEQIKRDREDNPAWQQYWEQQGKENDEARARIGQMQERHEAIMKEHSLDSALAAGDDDYLRIADRFYQDAKKMIDAPSKYADDNQGALGDFWQGIKDTGWNAVSLVDLAHKLHEIPFLETVKKIQKSEGNNANVYDLIKNHPDRLYEMGMGDAEVEMLKAFVHKADVESGKSDLLTKSYQAGQSMAKSLGFMADFIAVGGIGDAAAEAVARGLVKQAGRKAVPKLAAESFGGLVKAAAMTPLMPSTYANFIGNLEQFNDAGGIDLSGKAMLKDVGDILIENVSETIGAKPLELIGMPLQKVKFPAWAKAMRNSPIAGALKQAGYNGFFEEMFEEWTGSALRTLTGVDKEALKDFRQMDQILVTAGSFAPVALLGGSVSAAQFHTASKAMRDKGAVIDGIIGGLQDENAKNAIKDSFDKTRDIETPEDLAHAMTDVYQQIVQNGGNEEQAFKAVMDYTEAASRYKVMNGMFEEQKDIERSQKLAEMDQQMGNTKWHHLGKNGSSYVRTITDDQGNERFVTGEDDTNLLVVDKEGKPNFISKESLATGVENGTLTDSGEQYLFDYIDKQNLAVKQEEEQVRMVDEKKAAHEEVMRRALPDTPVNPEKPEEGTFRGIVGGRYVIQYPDGSSQDFSEEEIANKLGIRTVPETDAEIEAKDDAHEEKLENMHTAMNQFKGRHIVLPGIADMGYTLTGVVRNRNSESYPFSVFFRDADGHESGTGVSEEDMDALLAEMQAEQPEVQVPDVDPEVEVADNIPRDFRGNPLPMRQNEQTGETVVDEDALRENDIEAWVRYNDANPNRVVSSRDWLAFNIKKTASEVTKAADEITNAELNGVPARQKDAMKKALADKEKLLQSYESAMQRLTTPEDVIGDMPSYIADEQQPETQETAAPSMRDFRGNPIPMADESEVDETAFFQQDPEAWMEWNNSQMNDGGEDSRNYVKGEIGRENKNIARLQKEYNGEKDFKKRKELRKKIQDAQQRIADLEQAVENVEKRMQRRSARELEPQSVDEVIALGIANFKGSIDRDELKRETGMSDADLQGFVGGFVKEGGMSIGQLAEAIKTADDTHLTDSISDDELRSDIIEFLRGSTKWSDITNYIANKRAVQKAEEERQVQEAIAAGQEKEDEVLKVTLGRFHIGDTVAFQGEEGEYDYGIIVGLNKDKKGTVILSDGNGVEAYVPLKAIRRTENKLTPNNQERPSQIDAEIANSTGALSQEDADALLHKMTDEAEEFVEIELTPENWIGEFGENGEVETPIGTVKMGENQYFKLAQKGREGKLGMVKPTLTNPDVIIEQSSHAKDGQETERKTSYVFIKSFIDKDGNRQYYFTSVTVQKNGREVVVSNQEKTKNRISKLLHEEKAAWINSKFSSHPTTRIKEPVPVNDSNGLTSTDNQPALLGINSSELSENKDSEISETQAKISEEEAKVDTEPTEAQKEAGNYRKGHIKLDGYNISIEQPKGSIRSGIDEQGNPWSVTMNNTYGYIRGTEGVDGDHIDVFLSDNPEEGDIFVVDQIKPDGSFDEHKVMFGFPDMEAARKAYLSNYSEGWQGLGAITAVSREEFKKWVESSHRKTKPFSEYKSVTAEGEQHEESSTADQEEGSETVGYSVERRFHKKNGNYIYALSFKDRLSKDEFKELKNRVKDFGGYYSSYGKGGFIFDKEDSARKFGDAVMDHTGEKLEEARPVSMEDIVQADAAAVQQTDETSQELGIDASMPVSYKGDGKPHTILMVTKTGEQVGAARFSKGRITTVVLNDLDNPGKMIYAKPEDIAQYVVPDIVPEEVNGYKAGDQVMYRDSAGLSSEIIDHFEKYGDTWFPVFKKKDGGRVQIGVWANVSPYVEQVEQNLQSEGSMEKPVNPSGNKLVTDEKYEELRRRMLAKLNGQMNMGIDPEILSIGVQMAVYHIEKGARKFVDFAKNMIADLGDAIRPYLKAFYNGARDLPEVEDAGLASEMTPYDEVRTFDVANFDKAVSNPIETAAEVVKEQEVQQQKEVAEKEIKKTRKSRKSSQNVLSLSLADGTSFTVDRSDYHTFLTPQAKEFFERLAKEDGRNFAFPELAYITYASENNVIIPASELEALPEFIEAERRIAEIGALAKERTGSEALAISEDQVHALADRLLEEGSYVGKKDYSGEVAREKKAFVIIGRPAAGKSSVFANPLSKEHKARIIDSDTVKPWLEGYDGGYGANYVHGASVRVADEALIRAASLGENIIIPRIGGQSIISETVLPLRAVGYSVELCYNELPTEGSIMRAEARFVQTGRYLSLQYLNAIGEKPINTYRKFVTKSIGETINELSEREIQELRRRLGRLLGVEDRMAGASGPGGREVLSGVSETLGEGFRALLEHGEFGSDPSSDLLVFDGSEWKNNDVDYGMPPVTVWSSKSGEPFPGSKEGPKDNKNNKPSKKKPADEGMTLFDMMEENNNENEPETTDSTQGEGSPDRAMGGVSAVGDRVLGTDGSGQSDGTEAGGNRAGEPGMAGEEPQLLSTVGSGRGSESVVDSGSQGQRELSDGGSGVQGGDATDGRKAVRRDSQKAGQKKGVSKPAKKFTRNFHYGENASEIDNYTPAQRLKANIDAVEVLATMFSEGRPATDEEKETLSKFRGWGGIPFGHYYSTRQLRDSYSSDAHRLADAIDVLDPNGEKGLLPAISKAALTSYYTPSAIARTMNRFLALSGFKGGSMLDPSMGSGIFEGTLPEDIQQRTMINGVELDWLTGQIAKALYPDANVQIKGFEEAGTAMDAFDVVESNIPFGSIKVFDPTWKHDSTPVRKAAQGKIHNYFAVKMLESTKPGGLCVIMTSNAILDTEGNSLIREHIADQAEILGIVRLPDNTFKGAGTSAVTDVLFLRKFRDSDDRNTTRDEEKYRTRVLQPFLSMTTKDAAKKTDGSSVKVSYNGYFGTHPEFMIGDVIAGNQYKADAFGLTSSMSTDEIADAMDKILEKKIVGSRKGKLFDTTKSEREVHEAIRESYVGNGDYISSGNIVEQDGKFGVVSMSKNKYGDVERNFQELPRLNGKAARIQAMFPIRTTMKKLVAEQIAGASNDTLDGLRKQLKESYDKFVKLYGRLQDSENTFLDDDIDGYMLRSLEKWREGEFVGLSDIFTKNTIKPAIDLSQAQDGQSAISVSLAEYGEIRPAFMEQMLGEKWYDLCKEMVFRIPFSEDCYETKDAYLSGDVKTKLEQARKAAEMDKSFQHNVDELEAVQPKDIPFDDISVHMGARWIPQEVYTQFLVDSFGISNWRGPKSGVLYSEVSDTFIVNVASSELGGAAQKWSTRRRTPKDIFEAALSDKTIKVVDKDDEGKEHLNVAETEAANEKVQELRESFEDWLPQNAERVKQISALYNDKFNRTVLRKFDGSHLKTPGLMGMELRPHQKDAVWMLINNRGGIVDHMVGAGKTLVMQSAIMEMRRMGIAKKPMIVALKSTVAQITKEFIEAYPSARILAPTEKDFEKKRRKELLAKIALNDYDCVIISHENYVGLPHTEEVETQVIREQLAQLDAAIQFLYGQEDQSQLTKRQLKGLEKRKANLEAKMQALLSRKVDREFTFESLGVDYLFVDECQAFKSLPYVTSYQNVAGLGDAAGSQKAVALLNGVRYLQSLHQGDMGTTFLSGTTITNSLVEIYNLLQYLRPREMESLGFTTFDAWAGTFAQRSGELEYGVTQELKEKNRFRRFDNVPELARLYAEIADVRNDMNLKLPKPKPRMHIVTVPASEKLKEINSEVINMVRNKSGNYFYNMGAIKKPTTDKSPFGLLASGISTKAAISMKLLDPNAEEEGGKIHAVCENVAEIYKKFNDQKGTQLIFCDTGVPTNESKYDVYTDIIGRLVNDYGIPRDEIVDIHVADTDKKRKELFTKVREGSVRVLIGGTKNMGTGVNVQTRLVALHHIDVPWTPADREQREGRGVRQGNIVAREFNDDNVDIYFYAAEESLDLYKYQLQDTKGKMFAQFKQGTIGSTERSFDEGSGGEDGTFDPAEIVALLSGNPVILEKSKQDKKVEKLRRAKRTFESEWHQRKSQYDSLQSYLYTQESFLRQNKRDIDSLEAGGFKKMEDGKYPTTVTVEDYSDYGTRRTFDKPKEAGEYIHKLLKKKGASVRLSGFGQKANIQMAEVASPLSGVPAYEWQVVLQAWSGIPYRAQLSEDDTAAGVAFRNVLQKVFSNRETYQKNIDETKHKLEGADPGEMVFPKQAELDEAESKKKELDAQYKALAPKEEKKPASSENPEESVSLQHYDINLGGTPEEKSENIHRTSVGEDLGTVGRRTGEVPGRDNDYGVWRRSYDISDGTGPGAGRISLDNLERLFRDTNINQEIVPLFEKVIALAKENGVIKTYFRTPKSGEIRGQAMYTGDVYFNPSILTAPEYTGESAVTILHELIHGLTISTLRSHELGNKLRKYGLNPDGRLTAEQKAAAKEIERIYKRLHDNLDTSGMSKEQKKMLNYRLVNQYEMVAGMSDQRFRDYLRSVEDGPTNLWERLKAAIKRILGIDSGDTLTRLEKAVDNLLDNFRIETFEDTSGLQSDEGFEHYSIRTKPAPTKTGIGYKVFYRGRDGKLYPPMVANPGGEDTPVGVWLDADAAPVAGQSKTGRPQVKAGGKGTQGGSGRLAYRPGWHLGEIPYAIQFNRINPETGRKELFPRDFVWAEVEYAADNDYQQEAEAEGTNASGNYQHSLAGLKRVPEDGFYRYRTNPNPETDPWIITGAMKVNRILTDEEVDELVRAAGREPQQRESDIVRNRIAETSDSRKIAGILYDRYENQNGEDKPWMSEEELFERVEEELPYDQETKPLFSMIDEYRRLSDEDFDEGRRDFSGGEMSDLFNNFLSALKSYSEAPQIRNRVAGVEGFISNAEAAVNAIKQEKATPEQWLKMIEKNGGLKAGEDKWLGLSDWLKASDKKSITKQEVLDFINENKIRIEETRYAENPQVNDEVAQIAYRINDRYDELASEDLDMDEIYDTLLREFPEMEEMEKDGRLVVDEDAIGNPMYRPGNPDIKESYRTRLNYTTNGLKNKREIALTVPTIEKWNESDTTHFGDAGEGRAVAWVRFGDAEDAERGRVLFIDEIQSKRHQEGREKGYQRSLTEVEQTEIDQANKQYHEALQAYHEADQRLLDALQPYKDQVFEGRISGQQYSDAINTDPEIGRLNRERNDARDLADKYRDRRDAVERRLARTGVPPAPFEKNWHELAMKRMLRLAAEEGYDYVAWTTGEQQAERYNIGNYVSSIDRTESDEGTRDFGFYFGDSEDSTWVQTNDDGIIIDGEQRTVGELKGKPLSALVGKEVAVKMMQMKVDDVIEDVNTIVGGEGMKGFYDDILPRFMNKYGKQWGVKVSDETVRLSNNTNILTHMVPVTQEMKDSVMEGQLMFREGKTQSPVQYSESLSGKREAVNRVAELCGVEIEFKPSSEMRFKGKPLAGRWINGRMQVCLEHCRDEADAVRTVLHEGVGHNGLRRLIGNENMREFCLELFQRLPEQARKQIADAAVNKYGLNIAEAVEEYLAEQAEIMDFENEDYSRSFWDIVRDALRKVLSKIGIDVSLSERDVRWLMWQSYNANKQRDPLNEVKRQVVANKLGFTLTQQADKMEGIQIARNRVALEDELDAATDAYNEAAASLWNRMKETFVDQYQSVGKLVSAIEDATGKKAASFEDIRLALNRHSSKALATMQKWIGKYNTPMWDAIKELREKIGGTVNDVSRYVMLKHGLERNEVFAKRDAREYYQGIRDRAVNEIKATKDLSKDEKDQRIAKEDARLEKHLKAIEAGTNAKYREFRQRDYGGLTSFYSEFDKVDPQRPGEGKERYNARLQKARHPKYTTVDENGRVVVDMAATEKAAADEVAAFERQSEGLTDKLWQRINAATKATLEHQYQSNMLSRKQYEQVRDMFKYYVPLRGFEDDTAQDLYSYYNEDQRGNFEKPLIRAACRKTRAESPFGHIGAMASSGIAADMKNETKLSLYYFVSNRPNNLVTISDVWYEKTGETDEDGREVFKAVYPSFSEDLSSEEAKKAFDDWEEGMKEKAKSGLAFKGRKNLDLHNAVIHIDKGQKMEHVVKFKVGGRDMMMYINGNPRAAQAINGELNYNAENNFFVRAFNAVLRTMAALNTALNPEFWISNFQRDALFSLMSVDVKEGSKYRDAFAKNLVSGKTIFKMKKAFDEGTLGDSKDEQLFREFAENGGITGYTVVYDNEYWEKKLDEYAGKDRNVVARFNDFFKSISDFGEAVEIRTRFAAYKTSREMGKDIIGSVNDAKELTVNFNRKGSGKAITLDEAAKLTWRNGKPLSKPWQLVASMFSSISPLGRRMIMFFNAAVQGLNAMVKLYKTNPKRMAVWSAGYLAVGMINAILHSMLDDDDDYLDIPDWERRNNLLLGGKRAYLKWALPQEARVFYALGDMVVNHALGREPHKYLAVELLDAVGEALPIDVASGVGAFLPSAAMPIIDIVRNKDYKGAKVHNDRRFYSEEERKDIPKWRDPLANTDGLYVGLAKVISRITGGDEYGAGWWNPDPNDIEHLVEGYTGGLGTTVEKMRQFFGDIAGGEFVVRDTPFLRRILSLNDERYRNTHTTELYYYYTNRAKDTKRQIREARKNGDSDKLDELYDSDDFEIMNICESYDSLLKWYSDELKFTDDKQDRKAIMHEQDAVRKEMIQEISNIGK